MDDLDLDIQSVFSLDSLDGEDSGDNGTVGAIKNTNEITKRTDASIISKCNGGMCIQNGKVNPVCNIRSARVTADPESEVGSTNVDLRLSSYDGAYNTFSFVGGVHKSHSARNVNRNRISRSRIPTVANVDPCKPRNRSVSYLEQFKKKIYGLRNVESSTHSTIGPEMDDLNNISSGGSLRSCSRLDTSELEFYETLMSSPKNKQMSPDAMTPEADSVPAAPSEEVKRPKNKKGTCVVLSKVIAAKHCTEDIKPDAKTFLQKREDYANRVHLMNKMKINRQKEKERLHKFKDCERKQRVVMEDLARYSEGRMGLQKKYGTSQSVSVPLTTHMVDSILKPKTKTRVKKQNPKANKTEDNNPKSTSNITLLQQRHKHEKQLVDSLRELILKT